MSTNKNTDVGVRFLLWLTPALLSIVGLIIWTQVTEIKQDVKVLLVHEGITKLEIENLKVLNNDVQTLKNRYSILENNVNLLINSKDVAENNFVQAERAVAKDEKGPKVPKPAQTN